MVTLPIQLGSVLLGLTLLGYSVYRHKDKKMSELKQKDYERDFMQRYREFQLLELMREQEERDKQWKQQCQEHKQQWEQQQEYLREQWEKQPHSGQGRHQEQRERYEQVRQKQWEQLSRLEEAREKKRRDQHFHDWAHRRPDDFRPMPLNFETKNEEHLLKLCKQYRSILWNPIKYYMNSQSVEKFVPKTEIHYLDFRRVESTLGPIPIEMIRWTEEYGLIAGGNGRNGTCYLLEKKSNDANIGELTIFYIDTQFDPPITDAESRSGGSSSFDKRKED